MSSENSPAMKTDLTKGSLAGNIWKLAAPTLIAYAFMDAFNIVDMIFVGRLGPEAIAAVSISGILMGVIRMLAIGLRTGTVAMVSRFTGSGDHAAARGVIGQSFMLCFIFSIVVALIGLFFSEPLMRALGASDEVVPMGAAYFRIMCVGGITMFMLMTMGGALRGLGDAVTPMIAMGVASLINIGLDPLLIFGIGPFPRLEVAGSALATVIARGVGSVILFWILLRDRKGGSSMVQLSIQWNLIARIVRIGLFSTLRSLSMNVSRIVLVRIIAVFGTFAVAAYGIGMRMRIFILILGFGLGDAAGVLVGQNLGAGKPMRAAKSAWLATAFYGAFLVLIGIVFLTLSENVIAIFNTHPEVMELGGSYLRYFALSLLFLDLAIILGRALAGAGDTLAPMFITIFALIVVGVPMVWGFSRLWGVRGAWIALAVSEAVQGIGVLLWFRRGKWKVREV